MTSAVSVLVVDDEPAFREGLRQALAQEGFLVHLAADGVEALEVWRATHPDLVLLDVMLPRMSGIDVCREIRAVNETPVIMVSARNEEIDAVIALEVGADDYVTKPFKFPVLLARIRSQLRQHEQSEDAVFKLGPYSFRPALKLLVCADDTKIRLTEKETNILKFLYRAPIPVVPRDMLLQEV